MAARGRRLPRPACQIPTLTIWYENGGARSASPKARHREALTDNIARREPAAVAGVLDQPVDELAAEIDEWTVEGGRRDPLGWW